MEPPVSEQKRSLVAYKYWAESSHRFDYFIAGLIGAVIAYIAQSYAPQKLGFNPSTLELVALLVLLSAFICAFKRIEVSTEAFRMMSQRLDAIECFENITKAQLESPFFQDLKTGEVVDAETAEQRKERLKATAEQANKAAEKFGKRSHQFYRRRNRLLFTGFALLLAAKVLSAYSVR
jgi:hypothetical protein